MSNRVTFVQGASRRNRIVGHYESYGLVWGLVDLDFFIVAVQVLPHARHDHYNAGLDVLSAGL